MAKVTDFSLPPGFESFFSKIFHAYHKGDDLKLLTKSLTPRVPRSTTFGGGGLFKFLSPTWQALDYSQRGYPYTRDDQFQHVNIWAHFVRQNASRLRSGFSVDTTPRFPWGDVYLLHIDSPATTATIKIDISEGDYFIRRDKKSFDKFQLFQADFTGLTNLAWRFLDSAAMTSFTTPHTVVRNVRLYLKPPASPTPILVTNTSTSYSFAWGSGQGNFVNDFHLLGEAARVSIELIFTGFRGWYGFGYLDPFDLFQGLSYAGPVYSDFHIDPVPDYLAGVNPGWQLTSGGSGVTFIRGNKALSPL